MSDAGDDDYHASDAGDEEVDVVPDEVEAVEAPEEPLYRMKEAETKVTLPLMTRFELARIVGVRAQQISLGAPLCLPASELGKADDPIAIATLEVTKKALPFVIRRYLPHGEYEDWKLQDLAIPHNHMPPGLKI